jgi:hypothetical protein
LESWILKISKEPVNFMKEPAKNPWVV